ncbi:hypothetical protein [Burkholderia ambifaria]|uniref:hypothetical protein n=1 Tax=Burkholderia ambifaria TaxID=152480 RepID=UPI001C934796|nr:hypothetical protein [Burkholderia ambifaria]MBY4771768.1 hypothetical protein [Burkholderia ambifaria]
MTLPASFPLSMSQVATELGLSLPLWLTHGWVIALAGKATPPVSFSDLLGQTGRYDGALAITGGPTYGAAFSAPFFGGSFSGFSQGATGVGQPDYLVISFAVAPRWTGNLRIVNSTTGASAVLPKVNSTTWQLQNANPNIAENRGGHTDNFTILPSA